VVQEVMPDLSSSQCGVFIITANVSLLARLTWFIIDGVIKFY
jgi:hypothetical protein